MEKHREIKHTLSWNSSEGAFDAEIINGVITTLNFCEVGQNDCKCLNSTNFKFLKEIHDNLGEMFKFLEEENKLLGYRYADEGQKSTAEKFNEEFGHAY